jgi:hypothetical protein
LRSEEFQKTRWQAGLSFRQQFFNSPLMIGNPGFHRRSNAQGLMNPTEMR